MFHQTLDEWMHPGMNEIVCGHLFISGHTHNLLMKHSTAINAEVKPSIKVFRAIRRNEIVLPSWIMKPMTSKAATTLIGHRCHNIDNDVDCQENLYTPTNSLVPKKNASCVANILDISTKSIPLYSSASSLSSQPNSIFLASLLLKLVYLAMLFIFQVTHMISSVHHLNGQIN